MKIILESLKDYAIILYYIIKITINKNNNLIVGKGYIQLISILW